MIVTERLPSGIWFWVWECRFGRIGVEWAPKRRTINVTQWLAPAGWRNVRLECGPLALHVGIAG